LAKNIEDRIGRGVASSIGWIIVAEIIIAVGGSALAELGLLGVDGGIWAFLAFFFVGWTQLLYLPAIGFYWRRRSYPLKAKGIFMTSGVLFMLSSACGALSLFG
jgi:hypothetical protein